jgi:hypothetical protein
MGFFWTFGKLRGGGSDGLLEWRELCSLWAGRPVNGPPRLGWPSWPMRHRIKEGVRLGFPLTRSRPMLLMQARLVASPAPAVAGRQWSAEADL